LAGKGKRVTGVFILMIGAGLILESSAVRLGSLITLIGTVTFVWGLIEARTRTVTHMVTAENAGSPL
jgi:hypothetical protein